MSVTHCLRGHEYTDDNTYVQPKGCKACRTCKKVSNNKYTAANREMYRLKAAQQRQRDPEHCREMVRIWAKTENGRNHRRDLEEKRRANKLGAFVEHVDRQQVFLNDNGVCQWQYCSEPSPFVDPQDWHLDHITPLRKGGEHSYRNVQVTHPTCNLKKH